MVIRYAPAIWTIVSIFGLLLSARVVIDAFADIHHLKNATPTDIKRLRTARFFGRVAIVRVILFIIFTIVGILAFAHIGETLTLLLFLTMPALLASSSLDTYIYRVRVYNDRQRDDA